MSTLIIACWIQRKKMMMKGKILEIGDGGGEEGGRRMKFGLSNKSWITFSLPPVHPPPTHREERSIV